MAAALMGPTASSAGLMPDDTVNPFAVCVMQEAGLDISAHIPATAFPNSIMQGSIVVALSLGAFNEARLWRNTQNFELEYWDLPEVPAHEGPRDLIINGYRAIREALKAHIRNRFGA